MVVKTLELKKRRCALGYFTQASMANKLGMKAANYSSRERGVVPFTADDVVKVCEVLGWTLEEGMHYLL